MIRSRDLPASGATFTAKYFKIEFRYSASPIYIAEVGVYVNGTSAPFQSVTPSNGDPGEWLYDNNLQTECIFAGGSFSNRIVIVTTAIITPTSWSFTRGSAGSSYVPADFYTGESASGPWYLMDDVTKSGATAGTKYTFTL